MNNRKRKRELNLLRLRVKKFREREKDVKNSDEEDVVEEIINEEDIRLN